MFRLVVTMYIVLTAFQIFFNDDDAPGGVRPMIAKHAGRNRKTAHSYQHHR